MRKISVFLRLVLRWVLIFFAGALFTHYFLLRPIVASVLEMNWDVEVRLRRAWVDFRASKLVLENLRIGNPYGFPRGDMLEISRVEMSLARGEYREGVLRPETLDVLVERANLMRRVSGHLNLEAFADSGSSKKKKGFKIAPWKVRFWVEEVSLMDVSGPLLQKRELALDPQEFVFGAQADFKTLKAVFSHELLRRAYVGTTETLLPAPEYHSLLSAVEQTLREQVAEKAEEANASSALEN